MIRAQHGGTTLRSAVKAYDVRGQLPNEINVAFAYRFAQACCAVFRPSMVVVGHDMRQDSPALSSALAQGFIDQGVDVRPLGLCGTEEVYFHTDVELAGLGLMVTASHNPENYNGIKLILKGAEAVSRENGLAEVERLVYSNQQFANAEDFAGRGQIHPQLSKKRYIERLLNEVKGVKLKHLKILCHAGNGCAGPIVDLLEQHLPIEFIKLDHQPDPELPNGVPNPLLPEKRKRAAKAVRDAGADLGLAWDGDFDRCFFYDHTGEFIEGYYIVGLIAGSLLRDAPGETVLYDPRLTWNTEEVVRSAGGKAVICKTGHAYFKRALRELGGLYGGEMSAHHYFRSFSYCDTGMLPWLVVLRELVRSGASLQELINDRIDRFPCSGELNFVVDDAPTAILRIRDHFAPRQPVELDVDGLSMDFGDWRFNLRSSNTEPLLRLNVETRADRALLAARVDEIREQLESLASKGHS